jgi:hypothetical protein
MDFGRIAMDPEVAARRFAARLEEAGLPPFITAAHDEVIAEFGGEPRGITVIPSARGHDASSHR